MISASFKRQKPSLIWEHKINSREERKKKSEPAMMLSPWLRPYISKPSVCLPFLDSFRIMKCTHRESGTRFTHRLSLGTLTQFWTHSKVLIMSVFGMEFQRCSTTMIYKPNQTDLNIPVLPGFRLKRLCNKTVTVKFVRTQKQGEDPCAEGIN